MHSIDWTLRRSFGWPRRRSLAASFLPLAALALGTIAAPARAQEPDFTSQAAIPGLHSGIVTSTGVLWDNQFADIVKTALPNGAAYNELAFGFMQCFGGGMIDDLLAKNFTFTNYVSASRYDQPSIWWEFNNINNSEFTYNRVYAPVAGSHKNMWSVGRDNDNAGPTNNTFGMRLLENPQYASSGGVGDGIRLHANNPQNPIPNTKYIALLDAGTPGPNPALPGGTDRLVLQNTLNRITNSLKNGRDYTNGEITTIALGAGAGAIRNAWQAVGQQADLNTQIYYWNNPHGATCFNFGDFVPLGLDSLIPNGGRVMLVPVNGRLIPQFLLDLMNNVNTFFRGLGLTASSMDLPYFEIQTQLAIDNPQVTLNGRPLTEFSSSDLYGDGSTFDYYFQLTSSDIAGLSNMQDLSITWDGPDKPGFQFADLTTGNNTEDYEGFLAHQATAPEPGGLPFMVLVLGLVAGIVARNRRADRPARA